VCPTNQSDFATTQRDRRPWFKCGAKRAAN